MLNRAHKLGEQHATEKQRFNATFTPALAPVVDLDIQNRFNKKEKTMNQEKRRGTPRARITEIDALYIAFASKFPAAEAEAFSVLRYRETTPLHSGQELTSIRTTEARLKKIVKLKMMNAFRNPATGITSYGATELGWEVAQEFGYELPTYSGISGISLERLNHFRLIAHVAAQMISPEDFHGFGSLAIEDLVSENEMRSAYEKTQRKHKNTEGYSFPAWREQAFKKALQLVNEERFSLADLVQKEPALLTVGHSKATPSGIKYKQLHQPVFVKVGEAGGCQAASRSSSAGG